MNNVIGKRKIYIVIIAIIFMFLLSGMVNFKHKVEKQFDQQAYTLLEEMTQTQKLLFQTKIDGQFQLLEIIAQEITVLENSDSEKIHMFFERMEQYSEFYFIGLTGTDGHGYDSENVLIDTSAQAYFQTALSGVRTISEPHASLSDGETVVVLAVPIFENGEITGVVTGANKIEDLVIRLQNPAFNGANYAYVTTNTGEIITIIGEAPISRDKNIFDVLRSETTKASKSFKDVEADLLVNKSGIISYNFLDEKRIAHYEPFGINDWYIYTVVPESGIMVANEIINEQMMNLVTLTVVMFGGFIIYILYPRKNN